MTAALTCRDLTVGVAGRTLIERLSLDVHGGEVLCILGINGAGKTSLLETLCGLRAAASGRLQVAGHDVAATERATLARAIGLMPQRSDDSFTHDALALAAMGRHPHKRFWEWQDDDDLAAGRKALGEVGLAGFDDRLTDTLSGGERQRLALAMLLVQSPGVLLLDEPLSQLDPAHQRAVGDLLRGRRDAGHAVVMSVHDVNAAARLADRVLLLWGDGRWRLGDSGDVLREVVLSELYGTPIRRVGEAAFLPA